MFKNLMSFTLLLLPSIALANVDSSMAQSSLEQSVTNDNHVMSEFSFNVGGFYANSDSYMVVTNPKSGGTFPLDFEDDLNLKEQQFLPFFEFTYSFNQKHNVYLDWKSLHRTARSPALEKEFQITIDDTVYDVQAGISLQSTLDIDILRLGYGYDFAEGSNYIFGVSVGLHTMFIKTAFEGDIGICVPNTELAAYCDKTITSPRLVDNSVTAPLPDIGLYGTYEFLTDWVFKAHAQYFAVQYDNVKGSLIDIRAVVEAKINDSWSLTAGFNYYKVDVDYEQTLSVLEQDVNIADYNINYSFTGPMISVMYSF
ncbi:hypothetical protein [Shewanella gaetbuli]|uniref:Outer membrane protein beta-barrel domain-containing protein n=1 Tax=Shewanella gaetbuli TaxID=220752 RepID=A0A9X1ZNX0_9GAMM|nr:hypothetical protein [Shewanella gaetbuli]MCL1143002.1 hypothetical protein [Shewanella gaetbuli]